jgi:hypothetical protein
VIQHDDRAQEIRRQLVDARLVCRQLGFDEGAVPQAHGLLVRCPWHADRTPSLSVRPGPDGTIALKCHGCGCGGDVFHLVAAAHGLDARRDFPEVLKRAADLAGIGIDSQQTPPPLAASGVRPAERTYPPADELGGLWGAAGPVSGDAEVAACLRNRGLDPAGVDRLELSRALPANATVPRWASYQRQPWPRIGHRLLVPLFDASGAMRSVRAWRVTDHNTPKRLPPAGHRLGGLVLADGGGRAVLRGEAGPRQVVFVEGEPNMMSWALSLDRNGQGDRVAVFGVFAGGWNDDLAARVPDGATVYVRTDHDEAGDRYAAVINTTLGHRCEVRRLARPEAA